MTQCLLFFIITSVLPHFFMVGKSDAQKNVYVADRKNIKHHNTQSNFKWSKDEGNTSGFLEVLLLPGRKKKKKKKEMT